ncbi:MAG: hypothetical protein IJ848_01990 [Alphaproteobacteria bacterium]|nr:hypothetical protein [Alphaproteobacteria bacterium]
MQVNNYIKVLTSVLLMVGYNSDSYSSSNMDMKHDYKFHNTTIKQLKNFTKELDTILQSITSLSNTQNIEYKEKYLNDLDIDKAKLQILCTTSSICNRNVNYSTNDMITKIGDITKQYKDNVKQIFDTIQQWESRLQNTGKYTADIEAIFENWKALIQDFMDKIENELNDF